MKRITCIILASLTLILISGSFSENTAFAATPNNLEFIPLELGSFPLIGPALSGGNINFSAIVNSSVKLLLALLAIATVASIVFYGIQYMVTGAGVEIKKNSLAHVTNAFYGLLLLIVAFILLNTINPELVTPGLAIYNNAVNTNSQSTTVNSRTVSAGQAAWFYDGCTQRNTDNSCTTAGEPSCDKLGFGEADPTQCAGTPQSVGGKTTLCCSGVR